MASFIKVNDPLLKLEAITATIVAIMIPGLNQSAMIRWWIIFSLPMKVMFHLHDELKKAA
jgi:hypothetical protein